MFGKLPRRTTGIEIIIAEFVISDLVCCLAYLGRELWGLSRYKLSYDKLCGATASTRRVLTQASRVGHRSSGRKEGWRKKAENVGLAARGSGANGQDQFHLVCAAGTGKRSNALRRGAWPYSRRTAVGTGRAVLSFPGGPSSRPEWRHKQPGHASQRGHRELRPIHFVSGLCARQILDAAVLELQIGGPVPSVAEGTRKKR